MNAHVSDHPKDQNFILPSSVNPRGANSSVQTKIQSKLRKNKHGNGNGQAMAGHKLSAGIQDALAGTRATQAELQKYIALAAGDNVSDVAASVAAGLGGIAVGANAKVTGRQGGVAVGGNAQAVGQGRGACVAVGTSSIAGDEYTTAVGAFAAAQGTASMSVGTQATATGNSAIAVGLESSASGDGAIALGSGPTRTGQLAGASASGAYSLAFGYTASVSVLASNAIAIGNAAQSTAANAVVIGSNANASGAGSIAMGSGATTQSSGASDDTYAALTLGAKSTASGWGTHALGAHANATGTWATALGSTSRASGDRSVALGYQANASGARSVALGYGAVADRDRSVSVGSAVAGNIFQSLIVNVTAGTQGTDAVNVNQLRPVVTALGGGAAIDATTGAVTGPIYTLANGGRQTTLSGALSALDAAVSNAAGGAYDKYLAVKTGTSATDLEAQAGNSATALGANANANAQSAVALGGNTVAGYNAIALGTLAQATAQDSSAVGMQSIANNQSTAAFGFYAIASGKNATSVGNNAKATGTAATVIGQDARATGNYAVAAGIQANAIGSNTVAIGVGARSNQGSVTTDGDGNITIGAYALVDNTGAGAIAIGRNAKINNNGGDSSVTGAGAIALGDGATAYGDNATAIGKGAKVLAGTASVALGADTLADADMSVSVGNKSTNLRHRIVNMDAGRETYDAINVNQLQPVMTALGGGASIDPATGAVTGPTYTLANGGTQTTLSGALRALDQAVSNAGGENDKYLAVNSTGAVALASGEDAIGLGSGASASGNQSVALGMNSIADAGKTVSVGSVVIKRKIVNLAPGDLSVTSSEAVTGAQLYTANLEFSELRDALNNSGVLDPSGNSLAVTYNSAAKDTIMLGTAGRPVEIMNVATAIAPTDAVNLTQLNDAVDGLRSELTDNVHYVKVNSTGADANAAGPDAVAIGSEALATVDGTLALGVRARASAANAVAIGSDSLADLALSVSVGNKPAGLKRRLVNMEAGADADDAINVSQLQPVVLALGGGAAIDPATGVVTGPVYRLANGGEQTSLEAALGALDQAVSEGGANMPYLAVNSTGPDAVANGNDAVSLGSGALASATNSVALGANAMADVANTVSVGTAGGERKIVHVLAGDVSAASTDAVTGAQLDATNQQVGALENALSGSGLIDPGTGTSLAVTYTNPSKNMIQLGNLGAPVEIMNVATGLAASDAVNLSQLTDAVNGVRNDLSGNLKYVKVNATGTNANAGNTNAVAIGSGATASESGAVAIGTGARALHQNAVALGFNSATNEPMTVSVGTPGNERKITNVDNGTISADSTDAINGSQLFGVMNTLGLSRVGVRDEIAEIYAIEGVRGDNNASLNGWDDKLYTALAFGSGSVASGKNAVAFGVSGIAGSDDCVALGCQVSTGADLPFSVAVGSDAQTTGEQAIAVGAHVQANKDYGVAVGNNNTYALGVSSIAIGDNAQEQGDGGVAVGKGARVGKNAVNAIAIGTGASVAANLSDAIALGTGASVGGTSNGGVALGKGAVANRGNAVSLGATTGSDPVGTRQIINLSAGTQATDAVNVTQLQGVTSVLGGGAGVGADGSIVPPTYTVDGTPYADVGAAINAAANMVDPNAVSYDDATKEEITFGGDDGTLLTNVGAGSVASSSMDAINGSQLFGTAQSIATGLGSGAAVKPDGTLSPPTYVVGSTTANDVGGALTNLYTEINKQLADAGVVDPDTGRAIAAVTYDGASQNSVTLGGTGATSAVALTNVAAGNVSSPASTDAVNGGQLFATNQRLDTTDQAVSEMKDALDNSGVLDPEGNSLAVTYADGSKTDIELGTAGTPVTVSNLHAGMRATDAVNIGQLQGAVSALGGGAGIGADGSIVPPSYIVDGTPYPNVGAALDAVASLTDPNAVSYDDTAKDTITFGGATGTLLTHVSAGDIGEDSEDAINGSQLYATNQAVSDLANALDNSGVLDPSGNSLAVTYVDATKTDIALGTPGTPVTISNVKPGAVSSTSMDTVNGSQLYAVDQSVSDLKDALDNSGLLDPDTGASLAVTYDSASKNGVTLGGAGAATPVVLHNVATGTADTDGVNVAQLTNGLTSLKTELTTGAIDLKYIKVNATGTQATASGVNAVCIGSGGFGSGNYSVAIGSGARASAPNAVAIGYNSVATDPNVVSVGVIGEERKIINVADGDVRDGSTDAVNGGQLNAMRKALDAITRADRANGAGVKEVHDSVAATEGRSNHNVASLNGGNPEEATAAAIGVYSVASGANTIAVGLQNMAGSDYSVALGYMAQTGADHEYSVAVGSEVVTSARRAVALGTRVRANGECALAMGSNETFAIGNSSIAMGDGVQARSDTSIAIGRNAAVAANANDALALGAEASVATGAIGSVALGHGAVADRGNSISIGGGSVGTRQIIHVAAGTEPTDAVNVAQLKEAMAAMMAEMQLLRSQLASRSAGQ